MCSINYVHRHKIIFEHLIYKIRLWAIKKNIWTLSTTFALDIDESKSIKTLLKEIKVNIPSNVLFKILPIKCRLNFQKELCIIYE